MVRSHEGRLDWLVPVRVGRMTASPYAYLRGAANVHETNMGHIAQMLPFAGL